MITSALAARSRAASAKHTSPAGQRAAPGHSAAPTLTMAHDFARGSKESSDRSPVSDDEPANVRAMAQRLRGVQNRRKVLRLANVAREEDIEGVPELPHFGCRLNGRAEHRSWKPWSPG